MTLVGLLEDHYLVQRLISPNYEESIRSAIRTLESYLATLKPEKRERDGPAQLRDLSDDRLHALSAWMIREKKARPTVNRVLRTLCALAKFAYRRNLSKYRYRPDVEKLPESLPRPTSWRRDELRKIFAGIATLYGDALWGRRMTAVMLIYRDTALRAIDALRLESTPEEFDKGVVFVTEKKTKQRRVYILTAVTLRAIRRNGGTCEAPVPYPFQSMQPIRRRLRRVLKHVGLPFTRRDLMQKFRRTTATIAHHEGLDATELLHHSARWVTKKYYIDEDFGPPTDVGRYMKDTGPHDEKDLRRDEPHSIDKRTKPGRQPLKEKRGSSERTKEPRRRG